MFRLNLSFANFRVLKRGLRFHLFFGLIIGTIVAILTHFISAEDGFKGFKNIFLFGWFIILTLRPVLLIIDICNGEKIVCEGILSYHESDGEGETMIPITINDGNIRIDASSFNSKYKWEKHVIDNQIQVIYYTPYSKTILQIDDFELQ